MKFWTKSLLVFCIFFMAVCAYFLYRELTEKIDNTGGEVIGTITFKKRSASRRYSDNVIWEEIEAESQIFNYDAIRTQEYSSAIIALKDGTKIELDQNTLLVVILSDKGLNLNFDQGGVSAESGSGTKGPITLNSKDATIALDKGAIAVNSSDAGMNIHVSSGNAKLAADGKEMNISPDEIATLKNGVAESIKGSLFPELPAHNSYLVSFTGTRNVNFSWRSEPQGEVKLEISNNSSFNSIVKSYKSGKSAIDVSLPAGDYYWRISRGDAVSRPSKFTILADRRPELIAPHMNQKISLAEGSEMVTFRWEKSKFASSYELTAARDRKMSDIALTLTSRVNIISAPGLKPGRYYWTVKSIYSPGILSEPALSGLYAFEIEKMNLSDIKPIPLDQGPVTTAGPFNLSWKGVPGSKSYKVDLSRDEEFKDIIVTKKIVNTFVTIDKKISEGRYFWRVSALMGEKISSTSVTAVLSLIRPVQLITLTPPSGAVLSDKTSVVSFSWRDPNNGERYLLEVSDRRDFRNLKHRVESAVPLIDLKKPVEGNYFWRVLLKDNSGGIIAQSSISDFIVPGNLRIPVLAIPQNYEKIIPGLQKRLRFEWEKIAGANEYEIEFFRRVAGTEKPLMIYSSKLNYIELSNQSVFIPGMYSWLVRARDVRKGRVMAYKESRKSYFEVEEIVLLPAPVVNNPGIIFK